MIISATLHYNSKSDKFCCSCDSLIRVPYLRLYGSAHGGRKEHKSVLYKCIKCELKNDISGDFIRLSKRDKEIVQLYADDHCYELGIV